MSTQFTADVKKRKGGIPDGATPIHLEIIEVDRGSVCVRGTDSNGKCKYLFTLDPTGHLQLYCSAQLNGLLTDEANDDAIVVISPWGKSMRIVD